ncbi:LIM domain kinase 1 [Collichthys lucidus]|uniref:LIM domain kinase 1 n=1 Tax=Collichthys lucidus TaxID=240159 RepID=A0A4U5V0C7_COLLU|nr:LIM domain kinase 1 [Collichthys lucidus]
MAFKSRDGRTSKAETGLSLVLIPVKISRCCVAGDKGVFELSYEFSILPVYGCFAFKQRHPAGGSVPVCAGCKQRIYDEQYLQALNTDWHTVCFRSYNTVRPSTWIKTRLADGRDVLMAIDSFSTLNRNLRLPTTASVKQQRCVFMRF